MKNPTNFEQVYSISKKYTITSESRMKALFDSVVYINEKGVPGDYVECGVFKGGSVMNMAITQLSFENRPTIHLYDTFEGMTESTELDVNFKGIPGAQLIKENPQCMCICSLDSVKNNMSLTGYPVNLFVYHKGDVAVTLKDETTLPVKIAILRLDTDWYESTKIEMEVLYDRISVGGVLIIDDYGFFKGARKAIDDFFASRGIDPKLRVIDSTGVLHTKE